MPLNQAIYEVWAPAKLNLFLDVVGRRSDGYHLLETLMTPIRIYDTIRFRATQRPNVVLQWRASAGHAWVCQADSVPAAETNLAVHAAEAVRARCKIGLGAEIQLTKRIPVGAGLGGGSSDAAATLLAANAAWAAGLSTPEISAIALDLGSDVPFFVQLVTGLYRDRGDRLAMALSLPSLHFVVVAPRTPNLTADVFRSWRESNDGPSRSWIEPQLGRINERQVAALLFNRLQTRAAEMNPSIQRVCDTLRASGLAACGMTGSGSACFALASNRRQACRVATLLRSRVDGQVFAVSNFRSPGARVANASPACGVR